MNSKNDTLLEQMSSFDNLFCAFRECSRGKRSKPGYHNYLFAYGEKLKGLEQELKQTGNYRWSGYRAFAVYEPKKRIVMAAPYRDRIVHTAMHRVLFPIIDPTMGVRTYACRYGMGNLHAVKRLREQLTIMRKNRYCIKLDVKKYFESIHHEILEKSFLKLLPERSLDNLLKSLIASHPEYGNLGRGIPIGNLTSQLFANFYLSSLDKLACDLLGIDFYEDRKESHAHYIRYMDDMVLLARDKEQAINVAEQLVKHAKEILRLDIPPEKTMIFASDPIPFLGFVLDEKNHRPLRRNEKRFAKKIKRATKNGASLSLKAQMVQSFEAWKVLGEKI